MIKPLQLFCFFIFSSQILLAQQGRYIVRNHILPQHQSLAVARAIIQDNQGFIYAGNDDGVLEFDGINWQQATTPYEVLALQAYNGYMYVGGTNGFGWLDKNDILQYHEIAAIHSIQSFVVQHIYVIRDTVNFYTTDGIYQVLAKNKQFAGVVKPLDGIPFTGIVNLNESLFVNLPHKGLQRLNGNRFFPVTGGEVFARSSVVFSAPYSSKEVLLGTSDSRLYIFDGLRIRPFMTSIDKLLSNVTLQEAAVLLNGQIALATSGGCFVFDKSGKFLQVINSQNGLNADAINGVSADKDGGLWLAHDAGISYAAVHLPVSDLNFSKIKSKINASVYFQQQLYLATDEGVLYLSANDNKIVENEPVVVSRSVESVYSEPVKITEERSGKRLMDLFKRRQKHEQEEVKNAEIKTINITNIQHVTQVYQKDGYKFKKLKGINWKCVQLLVVHNQLLAATENGLFEINHLACKPVLPSATIYSITPSGKYQNRLYIGTNAGLLALEWEYGQWKLQERARQLTASALSLVEEKSGDLWAGTAVGLFKLHLRSGLETAEVKKINKFAGQDVRVKQLLNKNFVLTKHTIEQIDPVSESFKAAPELQKHHTPHTLYISGNDQTIWVSNEEHIYRLNYLQESVKEDTLYLLNLINGPVTSIHFNQQTAYLATQKSIYQYEYNTPAKQQGRLSTVIRRVKVNTMQELHHLQNQQVLKLAYQPEKYDIVFDFAAASFDDQSAVMYQYMLEGSSSKWSDWTKDSKVNYSNLDEKNYVFKVRARNLHGIVSEAAVFRFQIQPPFWSTWWFYSVEFLFFSLMIGVSFYLNKTKAETRMATVLTFVSLFIVFEYIHVLVEPYVDNIAGGAPIFKILMNLLLATLLFPVEAYIRRMMKEKNMRKLIPNLQ